MDLAQEKLLNLMNQMRSQVPPEPAAPECTDVSWTVPHHFDASAIECITDLAKTTPLRSISTQ
ncbi:MAG: hypothetical protein ACYSOX_00905 [Planctomycetota bacterium]|jgi:hypothetical protein